MEKEDTNNKEGTQPEIETQTEDQVHENIQTKKHEEEQRQRENINTIKNIVPLSKVIRIGNKGSKGITIPTKIAKEKNIQLGNKIYIPWEQIKVYEEKHEEKEQN